MVAAGFFPDEIYAFAYDSVPSETVDKSLLENVKSAQTLNTVGIQSKRQAYGRYSCTLSLQV